MAELWKDIPGYEGRYQASSEGRIRSVTHFVKCHNGARKMRGKILHPGRYCKAGYVSVVLGKGANGTPVHELVALTFLGPRPDCADICHTDGDPGNNRLSNLRYDTRTENILDVYRQGKRWRKLSTDDVQEIRHLLKNGKTGRAVAEKYGISESTISDIKRRRTFSWLKELN